jgi:hypothetical protein
MLPDSDTESESENSQLGDNGPTIAEIPPSNPSNVQAAVDALRSLEGENVQQVFSLRNHLKFGET